MTPRIHEFCLIPGKCMSNFGSLHSNNLFLHSLETESLFSLVSFDIIAIFLSFLGPQNWDGLNPRSESNEPNLKTAPI